MQSHFKENYKNNYELIERIYCITNPLAKCYKAKHKKSNELRFLKIIELLTIKNSENVTFDYNIFYQNLKNEIEYMKVCGQNNENSVKFYESYETEEEFVFVMEYCDCSLEKYSKNKIFDENEIYEILIQLNNTFKIMKENKIVHRDLKQANILINFEKNDNQKFLVKLCDYGISKMGNFSQLTSNSGTMKYKAPEIMELGDNNNKYSYKCDLWSLGIIIYELLFKEKPYKGETECAIIDNIKKNGNNLLKKANNENLDNLIRKLLEYNPDKRLSWDEYFNHPFFKQKINIFNPFSRKKSLLGLHTFSLPNPAEIVYYSIRYGIRLIDTAFKYENEEEVGRGIYRAISEGMCKREDLIIIGKIWINQRECPEKALRETLKRLKLDYIDIYVDHWPSGKDCREDKEFERDRKYPILSPFKFVPIYDFWPKMEELVKKGLAKSLGVSHYNIQCLCNLLSFCNIKPIVNEVECHPLYIQKNLKDFCDKENIRIISYYPFGSSFRKYIFFNYHYYEIDCNRLARSAGENNIIENEMIKNLSTKYKRTPEEIILNWHYCLGLIPLVGPYTRSEKLREYIFSLEFKLANEDVINITNYFAQFPSKRCIGCKRYFGINLFG